MKSRVIVCPNCHAKIIPRSNTAIWKGRSSAMPVCRVCQRPLFTCSLCAMPGKYCSFGS